MPHPHHNSPAKNHYLRTTLLALTSLILTAATHSPAQISTEFLNQIFQNPPDAAKPMVRWWWFGPAVQKPELLRELQQMKADGIGGVELAFVYPLQLEGNLPFLSPAMLDAVAYANTEARKLGLRVDVTLCSGWPYGGPHIPLSQAATRLRVVNAPPNTQPKLAEGETILSTNGTTFYLQSHTLQQVKRAAVGAEGYVLDPFSREAVANHLKTVGEPLLKAFGDHPPTAIFSDSLEAYGADWTPTLPAEFRKRRGYDLLPHLPELVAGGTPAADQIRHDYGQTLTELVNENYLTQINDWAIAHHAKFRSQTYGKPAVSFSSQNLAALPEGEGPQWRAFSTLRWASSANHVFGNPVTSGETFTWLHSPVFRATPLDMKAEADIDFIMGENQLIFHGWPYSPPAAELPKGDPGWSLYAAAVFNDHNPWHPLMPTVDRYIARVSALLRQGQPANQVAILLPTDDALTTFAPGKVSLTEAFKKLIPNDIYTAILSSGYNYDFIDADAIAKTGLSNYQILVIPPTDRIPLPTLRKLSTFAQTGGRVISVGHLPTFDAGGIHSSEVQALVRALPLSSDMESLIKELHKEAVPDLQLVEANAGTADAIGFIRRKLPSSDIYFVANTGNNSVDLTATFATSFSHGQQIDPDSASALPAKAHEQPIHLAPYESRLFLFTGSPKSLQSKPAAALVPRSATPVVDIADGWTTTFTSGAKPAMTHQPGDWAADPATRNFSGEAIYSRDFTLFSVPASPVYLQIEGGKALPGAPNSPPEHAAAVPDGTPNPLITRTGPGMSAFYDPPIREAALVTLNGQPAGALWHPPYSLDVTKLLKPGPNHIEIHVFNTALNAWSANPPRDYGPLKAKYGDRFQMQDLDTVQPMPSGILGTVYLVTKAQ